MIKKILKNKIIFRAIIITEILATLVFAVFIIENYRKSDSGDPKYDMLAQEEVQIPGENDKPSDNCSQNS